MNICFLKNIALYFHRWTRKSYATFMSIGKLVNIGHLLFDFHKENFSLLFFVNRELFRFFFLEELTEDVICFEKRNLEELKRNYIVR